MLNVRNCTSAEKKLLIHCMNVGYVIRENILGRFLRRTLISMNENENEGAGGWSDGGRLGKEQIGKR